MKIKKILALTLSMMLMFSIIAVPLHAYGITPYWVNTSCVRIAHQYNNGKAECSVRIEGYTGTDKIDNVNITLSKVVGNYLIEIKSWSGLSADGDTFRFYDEASGVSRGSTYRLEVSADVHRNGIVEPIEAHGDITY